MLNDVADLLRCPVCGDGLASGEPPPSGAPEAATTAPPGPRALRCPSGHSFDVARQGYVNLLPGGAASLTADTPEMVRARREFLAAGHFAPLVEHLAGLVGEATGGAGCVLDAGAGTGHYLSAVLDRSPGLVGLAMDLSKHALRRAATAHRRIGAVVWDLWRPLPVRDGTMSAVLNVFAPRNAAEFARVLDPDGALVVAAPTVRHLAALIEPLGLVSVDPRKEDRLGESLRDRFRRESAEPCELELRLSHDDVEALVGMGPSARHVAPQELSARLARLPDEVEVEASFSVSVFRPVR